MSQRRPDSNQAGDEGEYPGDALALITGGGARAACAQLLRHRGCRVHRGCDSRR